jgi:hypothetical protein
MLSRHPPSHRNQAQPAQTLALDTECLERHPIWSAGDLQIVLVLERSQRSSSLWPHAAVNREFSTRCCTGAAGCAAGCGAGSAEGGAGAGGGAAAVWL